MSEDSYPSETLELIYNEVKDTLNAQLQSLERLNSKASVIIGLVGVITGLSLNLHPLSSPYLFGACMTLFLASIFLSFSAYKVKSYRRDPEPRKITEKYLREDSKKVKKQLIDNFIESYENNGPIIDKKARYINYSLILLFIGLFVLTLSIVVG
ncbi:MAG: hypothetical protein KAT65_07860 [Methanophagales archaeon]|nr:hypothetical protein [Methanophagales archaeon]